MPVLADLVDDFAAPSLDLTRWDDSSGEVFRDPGAPRARIPVTEDYQHLATAGGWDARGGQLTCKVTLPPEGNGNKEAWLQLWNPAAPDDDWVQIFILAHGAIWCGQGDGGVETGEDTVTYDAAAHAYWRVRDTGTAWEIATSPEGAVWTVLWTGPARTWVPDDVGAGWWSGYFTGTEDPSYLTVEAVNTASRWTASSDGIVRVEVSAETGGATAIVDYSGASLTGEVRNVVTNPSVEVDLTGVTTSSAGAVTPTITRSSAQAHAGTYSVQAAYGAGSGSYTTIVTWAAEDITGTVTASVWLRLPSGTYTVVPMCQLLASDNTVLAQQYLSPLKPAGGSWQRLTATMVVPDGATATQMRWQVSGPLGSRTIHLDAAMLEAGAEAHTYVDGSQPGCVWEGTDHDSASHLEVDVDAVTLYRIAPGEQPVVVRAGNRAAAPGGLSGPIEDYEAPLGVAVQYRAVGHAGGTTSVMSAPVTVTVPPPADVRYAWLKNPGRPADNVSLRVAAGGPRRERPARAAEFTVRGDPMPRILYDVRSAPGLTLRVWTDTLADRRALERLLAPGATLLLQPQPGWAALDEMYIQVGDAPDESIVGVAADGLSLWELAVRQVAAPVGAPVGVGGITWDDVETLYDTWDDLLADNASWEALYSRPSGG